MKLLFFKFSCMWLLLLLTTFCKAQLTPPFNVRNQYITQCYRLSPQQSNEYERILADILQKWNIIKNRKYSLIERKTAEKDLQNELCNNVRSIFSKTQYELWNRNHRGNLTVRFYKEDLGMSDKQFSQFRTLEQTYSTQKIEISRMNLLEAERSKHRAIAFQKFSNELYSIVPKRLADYLIYENRILNSAKTLSKKYTIISENKAIQYAILKFNYEKELDKLESQKLAPKLHRKTKCEILNNYEKSIHNILTNEEYLACFKHRDILTDNKFAKEYKMSNTQLSKYKTLRKRLAMKEIIIKQNKKDKANKLYKLQVIRNEFDKEMENLLGAKQYKRWKKNEQLMNPKRHN